MMPPPRPLLPMLALAAALAACTAPPPLPGAPPLPTLAAEIRQNPPRPADGECWARQTRPAVIETVTEQVRLRPEQRDLASGAVISPASYRTVTQQRIVGERVEQWFRVPCPEMLTPELIGTLQRALKARGVYRGAATAVMDTPTLRAVRAWQAPRGLDSATLSLRAARDLGLLAWDSAGD